MDLTDFLWIIIAYKQKRKRIANRFPEILILHQQDGREYNEIKDFKRGVCFYVNLVSFKFFGRNQYKVLTII